MEKIEKRDDVEIQTTRVTGTDGSEIEIKKVDKNPYNKFHSLRELGDFLEENNLIRLSYSLRYRDVYLKYSRLTPKEITIAKYLIGRKNVGRRWMFYASIFAGYCTSMLVRSYTEIEYEVLNPSEDFFLYSYITKIPRYLSGVSVISRMNIFGFFVQENDEKDSLSGGDDMVVNGETQEKVMLAHQIDNYQRKKIRKFDFVNLAEKQDFKLV